MTLMANTKEPTKSSASSAYTINLENLSKRLKLFYAHWDEHNSDVWSASHAIAVASPPPSEDLRYLKSSALNIWLLGYEFPETIMVFLKKQIHFLCSPKKASLLETIKKTCEESIGANVVIHMKSKNDDGCSLMEELLGLVHSQSKSDNPVVGYIAKEAPEGKLLETWSEMLVSSKLKLCDVTNGFSELFAVEDADELICVRKAAYLTSSVFRKFIVPKLEKTIDEERKVTHSVLMDETEKAILNPSRVQVKLKAENVDICYPPIFQSGGKFDLKPSASSNDDDLYYDSASVIISAVGSRYNNYCTNVARTFLIDATPIQSKVYEVLLQAHNAAISELKPGNKLSAAYKAAISVVEKEAVEFLPHLTKTAGTGIGLEFRESGLNINMNNDRLLKVGMVFNVSLGFQNLDARTNNPKTENFSMLLADTVIISSEKPPEVLSAVCSKLVKDVAYTFNVEEEEKPKRSPLVNENETFSSRASLRSGNNEASKEDQRKQHQAELARQKNEETARRLAGGSETADRHGPAKTSSELIAYKNVGDVPYSKEFSIQVDQKNEAILLPIYGSMVPFHISTVKSATDHHDNRTSTIRIIFNVPGTAFSPHDANSMKNPGAVYLKEITFRSKDQRRSKELVWQIKNLRRQVASRESERAERATLVTQEKLQLAGNRMKSTRLSNLWIRPSFGGRTRKLSGTLEAHVNGFRYSTSKPDQRIDIMYRNIKHAFFQPAEKEMITLLHFRLHNHIMVGNKKYLDVQFYVEVMDVVQTVGGGRRSHYDPDEIEEEQREREQKNRINMEFQSFVSKVHDLWGQPQWKDLDLEFDQPLRELGFHGVPHKSAAFMVPTSTCLVELIENPFSVITLSEIEIVNLERVGLAQKNFDMAIVFKDFKKDVFRIDSIPSTSLDAIKEWLDTTDLKYYESRLILNWKQILKTITNDPEKFIEDGGWEFLNLEASDSDSDASEESDQGYEPSDMEPESVSEVEEDSGNESLVESDEDDDEDSEEEAKGKTWEELEREASNADRERGNESDSEEERTRRKAKAFGKSRVADRRESARGGMSSKRPKLR